MLINADDLDVSPPEYSIDRLFPRVGVGFLYAQPASAKSFLAMDAALSIANGTPFLGRKTVQGSVIYCLGEGLGDAGVRFRARIIREHGDRQARAADIARREGDEAAAAWLASLPPYTDERIFIEDRSFNVMDRLELDLKVKEFRQIPELEMVVLDVAQLFTSRSIDMPTSAKLFMDALKWVSAPDQLDCLILAISHPNEKGRLPGTQLRALADFVYKVEPDPDGGKAGTIIAEKLKCGPLPDPIGYVIEGYTWDEPARDPVTGEVIPGAPPVETSSATVRLREDDQAAGPGGLRLPGSKPRKPLNLPAGHVKLPKPGKRNGIRPRAGLRPPAAPEPAGDSHREELARALVSVPCEGTAGCNAQPGESCKPVGQARADYADLLWDPLLLCHVRRLVDAILAGQADKDAVIAEFGPVWAAEPAPEAQPETEPEPAVSSAA